MTADRLGIEIETDSIELGKAELLLQMGGVRNFRATRDASIESNAHVTRSGAVLLSKTSKTQRSVVGTEFVSAPMSIEDFRISVRNLCGLLQTMGEPGHSKRSSVHIHIECEPRLKTIFNALRLFTKIEPLFYRLGGMGYEFRGISNNAIYCRPITHPYGPPVVMGENGQPYQLFTLEDLLQAETLNEFWHKMAIDPQRAENQRYHPARYFGLNIFSLILHGTMEFRYFNKTLNHQKINAVASLCQAIVELINGDLSLPDMNFSDGDDMGRLIFVNRLIELNNKEHKIRDRDYFILENIVTSTNAYQIEPRYIKTHLWDKYNMHSVYLKTGKRIKVDGENIHNSGFIDIHNIAQRNFDFFENMK